MFGPGSSGFSSPGFQFEAILSNLKPETVYYYAISGRKEEFSFLSPPALGTATPSKMIVMVGRGSRSCFLSCFQTFV